jgi:hypothetical protein
MKRTQLVSILTFLSLTGITRHAPAQAAAKAAPPPKEAAPVDGLTRVHIEADTPQITLHRMGTVKMDLPILGLTNVRKGLPVCPAPCDKVVDGSDGELFYFGGDGLLPSPQFQLRGLGPNANATVSGGSVHRFNAGIALTVIGGTAALTGLIFVIGAALGGLPDSNGDLVPIGSGGAIGGGITAGLGLGVLAAGIVLWRTKTSYAFAPPPVTSRGLVLTF